MPLGEYLAGLGWAALAWGSAGYVAALVERRRLPRLDPTPRVLALALLFIAALTAVHLIPGMLGVLSPEAVAVTAVILGLGARRLPEAACAREAARTPPPFEPSSSPSRAIALAGAIAAGAFVLAALSQVRALPPDHVDAMSFALPGVADWIRSGSTFDIGAFFPLLQVRTYPNNGEVLSLAAILPWSNDAFLRLLAPPLLGMIALAIYGAGRELRAPAPTAALFALAAASAGVVAVPAFYDLKPDAYMAATFSAGSLFLLRNARTGATTDLALGGLGIGLAFGSRWYGIPAAAIVLLVWLVASLVVRRPRAPVLRQGLILGLTVLAAGGYWLLRDLVETGNPLYPVSFEFLGVGVLSAPRDFLLDDFGFSIVDRLDQPGFVRHELVPSMRSAFGLPGALVAASALLAAAMAVRVVRKRGDARPLVLIVVAVALAIMYGFLPAGAQGLPEHPSHGIVEANARWLVPAFLLATCAGAWAVGRLGRARLVAELGAFAALLVTLHSSFSVGTPRLLVAGVAVALAWALAPRLAGASRVLARRRRAPALALAAVVALGLVAVGYEHQRAYNSSRFAGRSAVVDWIRAHAPEDQRVGIAGFWSPDEFVPIYALFGPRLRNDVAYVAPVVRDQVRLYRHPGQFARALRNGGYDLLAVGRLEKPDFELPRVQRRLGNPPEARWSTRAGFVEVTRDSSFILLARQDLEDEPAPPRAARGQAEPQGGVGQDP